MVLQELHSDLNLYDALKAFSLPAKSGHLYVGVTRKQGFLNHAGSSHSGRRGFAGKVLASTGDMDTVAILLGHNSIDCSQRYVDVDPATLEDMFANAL